MSAYYTQRMAATLVLEDTDGTFKQPVASDMVFPLSVEPIATELGITEGLRDANGKFSRGRYFKGKQSLTTTLHSYLMEPVDPVNTTGDIEISPLFIMSGFRLEDGTTNKKLVWDGETPCTTGSMTAVNLGCGTGTSGAGWDLRGMRTSIEIMAEATGSVFNVNAAATACVEDYSQTKTAVTKVYANGADDANVEMFVGSLVFDGVATAVDALTISMNATQKVRGDSGATGGAELVSTTDYDPKVTITAPVGADTASWWQNVLNGTVITELVYTGTYFDITLSDLSIANHSQADLEGELALTQELSFAKIEIQAK